jgi:hypothetical protein
MLLSFWLPLTPLAALPSMGAPMTMVLPSRLTAAALPNMSKASVLEPLR